MVPDPKKYDYSPSDVWCHPQKFDYPPYHKPHPLFRQAKFGGQATFYGHATEVKCYKYVDVINNVNNINNVI